MKELEYIKKLISIKSYSMEENEEIINYLIKEFSPYSEKIVKLKNRLDNKNNLIIGLNNSLSNINDAIILSGHIDTVIADEKVYLTNPYNPIVIDDKLYGLGVIDMKSFFACLLNNIERLKKLKKPIIIAITSDEETTFKGVEIVTNYLSNNKVIPMLTIVGEPTSCNVCTSSKSCYEYCVNIEGKSCHSSNPNEGINANYIGARLILYIEQLCEKYKNTTLSCNVVNGGEKVNVIANKNVLFFDIRSEKQANVDNVLKDINDKIKELENLYRGCKITLVNSLSILPHEKKDSVIVNNVINKFNLKEKEFIGGCEAGYYQRLGGDAIIFGCGDIALAHKPNEYADIQEFLNYNNLLINIIEDISNCNQ